MDDLVGKSYSFEDGSSIKILQIKAREDGPWVHYIIGMNDCLPRKLIMKHEEFMQNYKHLFYSSDKQVN